MKRNWEVLYHYTSLDTFMNIIKTKKFRLYDVTKSNDPLEGTYMLRALENTYQSLYREEKIRKDECTLAHRAFFYFKEDLMSQGRFKDFCGAASFCVPAHELLMLRSYADNGKGVALGVPRKTLETLSKNNQQLTFKEMEYLSAREVDYRATDFWLEKIKFWKTKISDIDEESLRPLINEIKKYYYQSYFFKDKVNEDEEEYRLLSCCEDLFELCLPGIGKAVSQDIDFISSNGDLKAYYEIPIGDRDQAQFYFSDVVIGPQCGATISEVQTFLCRYGIKGCNVSKNSWVQMR